MKIKSVKTVLLFFICAFVLSNTAKAQYSDDLPPIKRFVQLKKQVLNCEKGYRDTEKLIRDMEKNPDLVTLAQYNQAKKDLELIESCVNQALRELNELLKEFPRWASGEINVPEDTARRHAAFDWGQGFMVSAKQYLTALEEMNKLYVELMVIHEKLNPENH